MTWLGCFIDQLWLQSWNITSQQEEDGQATEVRDTTLKRNIYSL